MINTDLLAECNNRECKRHLLSFYINKIPECRAESVIQWKKFCRAADAEEYKIWNNIMDIHDDLVKCRYFLRAVFYKGNRQRGTKFPKEWERPK